jgi:predicted ATP-dependent endonuclease of OLD family
MQKLSIQNFGPIVSVDINVNDFMVIIGPQASGKSTISKSIYLFKSLKDDLVRYVIDTIEQNDELKEPTTEFKNKIRTKFVSFWGTTKHLSQFSLVYSYGNSKTIRLFPDGGYVKADFSPPFHDELSNIFQETSNFIRKNQNINKAFASASEIIGIDSEKKAFYRRIETLVNSLFEDDRLPLYIPAGRSLLSTLSDRLQKLLLSKIEGESGERNGNIDPYLLDYSLKAYLERISNLKNGYHQDFETLIKDKENYTNEPIDRETLKNVIEISDKIIKGRYKFENDRETIVLQDSKGFINLSLASSGQQEVVWILLQIFSLVLNRTKVFMVIEEPEAHLFPVAQKDVVELICLLSNLNNNQIMITTHSPYILSSLNNYIYAGKLAKTKSAEVAKLINKKSWLKPEKVAAFYIEEGVLNNIIDDELQLIKVEEIDRASAIINEQFNHLFELDLT